MGMPGRVRIIHLVVLLLGLCLTGAASAEVYECRDAAGAVRFQDRPCAGMEAPLREAVDAPARPTVQAQSGEHFFWRASAGAGELYLLGSIHFGTAQMYPLPEVMMRAFQGADALVVEADVLNADPMQTAQLVASKAMYQDGTRLQQQLSPQTWTRLQEVAASLGMPVAMLNMQKPWFVSMSLTALALKRLGYSEDQGIDAHFLGLARDKKQVIELESMAQQLSLFDRLSTAEQVMMLEQTLDEIEQGKAFFEELLSLWQAGDAAGVQRLFDEGMLKSAAGERLNQVIMIERNRQMSAALDALARQGGEYFVVVGAGHLPGPEGILALLRERGYDINQY